MRIKPGSDIPAPNQPVLANPPTRSHAPYYHSSLGRESTAIFTMTGSSSALFFEEYLFKFSVRLSSSKSSPSFFTPNTESKNSTYGNFQLLGQLLAELKNFRRNGNRGFYVHMVSITIVIPAANSKILRSTCENDAFPARVSMNIYYTKKPLLMPAAVFVHGFVLQFNAMGSATASLPTSGILCFVK